MAIANSLQRRQPLINAPTVQHANKRLRSGRTVKPWSKEVERARLKVARTRRGNVHAKTHQTRSNFMELPVELRLQIYGHVLLATSHQAARRGLPHLRPDPSRMLKDGCIVVLKGRSMKARLHSRSTRPSLTITATCRQIRSEALGEVYKHNAFEVEAMVRYNRIDRIFNLPGSIRLDRIRELVLVTHFEVSRFESCFTYDIFAHMTQLRKLSVAMKTIAVDDEPDFHSCLEALNLVVWIPVSVQIEFLDPTELMHHDHPAWICTKTLASYFTIFSGLRGAALGTWGASTAIAYDHGIEVAKCLKIMGTI